MHEKPPMTVEKFNGLTAAIEKGVTDVLTRELGTSAEPRFAENYTYWDISGTPIVAWDKKADLDDLLSRLQLIIGDEFEVGVASRKYDDEAIPTDSEEPASEVDIDEIDTAKAEGGDEILLFITKRI